MSKVMASGIGWHLISFATRRVAQVFASDLEHRFHMVSQQLLERKGMLAQV